jgi:hypothetical protein
MSGWVERLFVWVWRINGLLVLLGAGFALFAVAASNVFFFGNQGQAQVVQVAGADLKSEDLQLGGFRRIAGTKFMYAELNASAGKYIGSGSGRSGARNILFFDTDGKKGHWLLPRNDQEIASYAFLMDPPDEKFMFSDGEPHKPNQVAEAILIELQPAGSAAGKSSHRLVVASADGRRLKVIVDALDGKLGHQQMTSDSLLIFYVANGVAKVLDYDLKGEAIKSDTVLTAEEK